MGKTFNNIVFLAVYSFIVLAVYFFKLGGEKYTQIADWITYVTPLISVFFGYTTFKYFGRESKQGKFVLLMTFAILLYFVGDVTWSLLEEPVVSFADVAYFAGYFLIYAAIVYSILMVSRDYFKNKKKILIIASVSAILSFFYFRLVPLSWDAEIGAVENIATAGYLFADLILVILLVMMISIVFSGSYISFWMVFALGILTQIASDIIYTLNYESYGVGSIVDLGWLLSYILFALSFVVLKHSAEALLQPNSADSRNKTAK